MRELDNADKQHRAAVEFAKLEESQEAEDTFRASQHLEEARARRYRDWEDWEVAAHSQEVRLRPGQVQ